MDRGYDDLNTRGGIIIPESKRDAIAKKVFDVFIQRNKNDSFSERLYKKLARNGITLPKNHQEVNANTMQQLELLFKKEHLEGMVTYLHNAGFRETHLKDGNTLKDLIIHKPGTVIEPWATDGILKYLPRDIAGELARWIMTIRYNPQLLEMSPEEEASIKKILLDITAGKSTFILTNHDTFWNIPLIIFKCIKVAHKLKIKNVSQYIRTILWPLLMTHKWEKWAINSLSNSIITQPVGNNPTELKEVYSQQRTQAGKAIIDLFPEKSDGTYGNIVVCASSGTRDILLWKKDGTPVIYIPDSSFISNKTSLPLAKEAKKAGANVVIWWTNTTALKKGITPNNNDRNRNAPIEMHVKEIDGEIPSSAELITLLSESVTYQGNQIAIPLPTDVFLKAKSLNKSGQLPLLSDGSLDIEAVQQLLQLEKNNIQQ